MNTAASDDLRGRAIQAAATRASRAHGRSARHYQTTMQLAPGGGAHHIAVDGRILMADEDVEDAKDDPELLTEHEARATRDVTAYVRELLSQLAHEGLVVEGLGDYATNTDDLVNYAFAAVTDGR